MLIRHVRHASWILGAILSALLFFLGGAAVRLMMGPISLGPFAGAIEDSLNHSVSGLVVRFDQAMLEWSSTEAKINLIVLGTKVFDLDGRIIAQAPKADLDFDAVALMSGHLALKRFSLIGVQLTGVRSRQGSLRLGFGPEQGEPDLLETIRKILQNNEKSSGSLTSLAMRDARLAFNDEPSGLFIVSTNASFSLQEKSGRLNAVLEAAVEISGVPSTVKATAVLKEGGIAERGTLEVHNLSLPALVDNSPFFAVLKPYHLVSDLNLDFTAGEDGRVVAATIRAGGAGTVEAFNLDTPLGIDKFALDASYDGPGQKLTVKQLDLAGKQVSGKAHADLLLSWMDMGLASVSGDATAENVKLVFPAWLREPVALSRVSLKGAFNPKTQTLDWERASLRSGAFALDSNGRLVLAGAASPALKVTASIEALPVRDVLRYWPKPLGEGAYSWIDENVSQGRIGPAKLEADLPMGAMDAPLQADANFLLTFPFEGATVRYQSLMTPVTEARGSGQLKGDSFHATVTSGAVGHIAIKNGDVAMDEIHLRGSPAIIKAHADGKVPDVLTLIDERPLRYPSGFGIDPKTTSGQASVDLRFFVPMRRDVTREEMGIRVSAKASGLSLPLDAQLRLDGGDAIFDVDENSLLAEGAGAVSGVPVGFGWSESFSSNGDSTRIDVRAVLDEKSRPLLGLGGLDWVKGEMPFTATLTGRQFHFTDTLFKADATGASAQFDALNLSKEPGTPASVSGALHFENGGAISVSDLTVTSDDLQVSANLDLDSAHRLDKAVLSKVHSGSDNDFTAEVTAKDGGGLAVSVRGASLDASRLFAAMRSSSGQQKAADDHESGPREPLAIEAKLDRLSLRDDLALSHVSFALSMAEDVRLRDFSLDGLGPAGATLSGRMATSKSGRTLTIQSADAGNFLRGFTGFSSISGGSLVAHVSLPPEGSASTSPQYTGTIEASNVVVTDQPFMARLFAAGSLDGPLRLLKGEGIAVSKLRAPFLMRGKQITIRDGRLSGPAIGATFEGTIDRGTDKVDITGSLVPLYGLNSMLGVVPVLGDLLVSKPGEGVFGLTYAMRGELNEPTVIVNPLSVLTPGIFRRIFEFNTPKDMQRPAPQASTAPSSRTE